MEFHPEIITDLRKRNIEDENLQHDKRNMKTSRFQKRELSDFKNEEEAYHQLMLDIVAQQYASTQLVLKETTVKRIFVDGGFSKNMIYMNLLASAFPGVEVFAASMAQAIAVGCALSVHDAWNEKPLPHDMIELKYFSRTSYPLFDAPEL